MHVTVTTLIFGLPTGQRMSHVCVTLPVATLTVHELIAYKVRQEVEECLAQQRAGVSGEYWSPEEWLGTAARMVAPRPLVVAEEIVRAQQAFASRAYMIVVNNQRLWSPEAKVTLTPTTQVEFIKILPLVGG